MIMSSQKNMMDTFYRTSGAFGGKMGGFIVNSDSEDEDEEQKSEEDDDEA